MAAIQLNFSLRTSSNCKTVHLLGSWDNYQGQLPLSKDSSKSGAWKGTFRFQGSTLTQGSRYWYYYIIDGYHVSHDPAKDHVVEPTTGRKLNTLDIPKSKSSTSTSTQSSREKAKRASRRVSADVPKGRSLSPSEIKSPRPQKPGATKRIVNGDYAYSYDQLAAQLAAASISYPAADDSDSDSDSDADSDVPSLSSGSSRSAASSPSSVSYASDASSSCTCERYGITRGGDRVKLDCRGERCGYSDFDSCSSASEDEEAYRVRSTRRQGMYLKH